MLARQVCIPATGNKASWTAVKAPKAFSARGATPSCAKGSLSIRDIFQKEYARYHNRLPALQTHGQPACTTAAIRAVII